MWRTVMISVIYGKNNCKNCIKNHKANLATHSLDKILPRNAAKTMLARCAHDARLELPNGQRILNLNSITPLCELMEGVLLGVADLKVNLRRNNFRRANCRLLINCLVESGSFCSFLSCFKYAGTNLPE